MDFLELRQARGVYSRVATGMPILNGLHACSSFISQDERMSESPIETIEKALGLHFISKMGLTCLRQLESHVEFTSSNFDDA